MDNSKSGKLFKCIKCGKEKKESDGMYVLGGSAFCCKKCCGAKREKDTQGKDKQVCEFC